MYLTYFAPTEKPFQMLRVELENKITVVTSEF